MALVNKKGWKDGKKPLRTFTKDKPIGTFFPESMNVPPPPNPPEPFGKGVRVILDRDGTDRYYVELGHFGDQKGLKLGHVDEFDRGELTKEQAVFLRECIEKHVQDVWIRQLNNKFGIPNES